MQNIIGYTGKPLKYNQIEITRELFNALSLLNKEGILKFLDEVVKSEVLTIREVIHAALNSQGKDEHLNSSDKAKCFRITKKIFATKEPDFTPDEIVFICNRVDAIYLSPLVCGFIREFFKNVKSDPL